jgi:hypothetical protein
MELTIYMKGRRESNAHRKGARIGRRCRWEPRPRTTNLGYSD